MMGKRSTSGLEPNTVHVTETDYSSPQESKIQLKHQDEMKSKHNTGFAGRISPLQIERDPGPGHNMNLSTIIQDAEHYRVEKDVIAGDAAAKYNAGTQEFTGSTQMQ